MSTTKFYFKSNVLRFIGVASSKTLKALPTNSLEIQNLGQTDKHTDSDMVTSSTADRS